MTEEKIYNENQFRQAVRREVISILTICMIIFLVVGLPTALMFVSTQDYYCKILQANNEIVACEIVKASIAYWFLQDELKDFAKWSDGFQKGQESRTTAKFYTYPAIVSY